MQSYAEQNRIQYLSDILVLVGLAMVCAAAFGMVGVVIGKLIWGFSMSDLRAALENGADPSKLRFLKLYNVVAGLGTWVISGYLLGLFRKFSLRENWQMRQPSAPTTWLWILPLMFCSLAVSAFLMQVNAGIRFPEQLSRAFEQFRTGEMIGAMLQMNGFGDYVVNLTVIALAPAIFEEIFFRGTLQPLMMRLTGNHHAGIAITAVLFTLIHLNLSQILPMMLLALVLGYTCYYGKSIFISIVIHFINNAMAVTAYYWQTDSEIAKNITEDKLSPPVLLTAAATIGLIWMIAHIAKLNNIKTNNE